jgi:hypothetical protein
MSVMGDSDYTATRVSRNRSLKIKDMETIFTFEVRGIKRVETLMDPEQTYSHCPEIERSTYIQVSLYRVL